MKEPTNPEPWSPESSSPSSIGATADSWIHQRTDELAAKLLPILVSCVDDLRLAIDHTLTSHEEKGRETFVAFGDYEELARDAGLCLALVARGVGAEVAETRIDPDSIRALGRFIEEAFLRVGTLLKPGPNVLPQSIDTRPDRARDLTLLISSLLLRAGEVCPVGTPLRWRFHAGRNEDSLEIRGGDPLPRVEAEEALAWQQRLPEVVIESAADHYLIRVPRGRLAVTRAGLKDRS